MHGGRLVWQKKPGDGRASGNGCGKGQLPAAARSFSTRKSATLSMLALLPALRAVIRYLPFTMSAGVPVMRALRAVALAWRTWLSTPNELNAFLKSSSDTPCSTNSSAISSACR